jgi:diguanylate cyclase (GGDEF)-like protein
MVSLGLLVACGLAIAVGPWDRVPDVWALAPLLAYCLSVMFLQWAQGGPTSGIGVVILAPVLWTVLYHRRLESVVVVGTLVIITVAMAIHSGSAAAVIVRRGGLWLVVGLVVVVAVHNLRDHAALAYQELAKLAATDELTGLWNRRGMDRVLDRSTFGGHFAVLAIDVDNLKAVNDKDGHESGDETLRAVGAALGRMVRGDDVVARTGGDEFAIVCYNVDQAVGGTLAQRIVESIGEIQVKALHVSVSIGVAEGAALHDLRGALGRADRAMYRAKQQGGGRFALALEPAVADRDNSPPTVAPLVPPRPGEPAAGDIASAS